MITSLLPFLGTQGLSQPLVWELVPPSPAPLPLAPASPGESVDDGRPAARTLAWERVPPGEVIDPAAALAGALAGPDPNLLPPTPIPPLKVRGLARGITVTGAPYPDVGLEVPNGFAVDPEFSVSTILAGVNRTRPCSVPPGFSWIDCADVQAYLEITPIRTERASLGFQWGIQSLSSRNGGTATFAGQSLGFKAAVNLSPTTGLAFGGENIIQLDDTVDLGRNFYLVLSQAIPLGRGPEPMLAVVTVGIGSDFFGYGGNGTLGATDCLSGRNISSLNFPSGTDCFWGPIGSVSLLLNSRLSIGAEWFGYGFGAGLSLRPIKDLPLTFSLYATDFLGNNPSYISSLCTTDPCEARYYGRLTLSF